MSVVQRKDECLGQEIHVRLSLRVVEHFCINGIAVSLKHQFNLRRIDNAPVEFVPGIGLFAAVLDILYLPCIAGYLFQVFAVLYGTAIFSCLGLDTIDAVIHVDTIGNGALQRVIDDAIIVEESLGLRRWRCCKADNAC